MTRLVADLAGCNEDVAETFAAFMRDVEAARRGQILDELAEQRSEPHAVERVAVRWDVSARRLYRWQREARRSVLVVRDPLPKQAANGSPESAAATEDSGAALANLQAADVA